MITRKLGTILTGCYLVLAASALAYELGIRIYDRGNSEFAGMLSMAVTLPASLLLVFMSKAGFGVNVGDSDVSFVIILGLSALANAWLIWMILAMPSCQKWADDRVTRHAAELKHVDLAEKFSIAG